MRIKNLFCSIMVFALVQAGLLLPALGADFSVVSSINADTNPAVAYNSVDDEYLVVYEYEYSASDHDIKAKILDSNGLETTSFTITQEVNTEINPCVTYNSALNQYMVAWEHETSVSNHDIKAKIISADGNTVIDTWTPAGWPDTETDPDIAYNATDNAYMVVWVGGATDNKDIYGRIFDHSGVTITLLHISSGTYHETAPGATYNYSLNNYLVLWHGRPPVTPPYGFPTYYTVYGCIVSSTGTLGAQVAIGTYGSNNLNPRAEWTHHNSGEYLVVMEEAYPDGSVVSVKGQRLNGSAAKQGSIFTISGTGSAQKYGYPDITFNIASNEYLVSYVYVYSPDDFDLYSRKIAPGGIFPGDEIVVSSLSSSETFPSIVSGENSKHLFVWQDYRNSGTAPDIYGSILGKPFVTLDPAGYIDSSSAQLRGWVNPNGRSTHSHFEYGLTTDFGSVTPTVSAGSGISSVWKYENISGLLPNATYYFRLTALNDLGEAWSDGSFRTLAADPTIIAYDVAQDDIGSSTVTLKGEINPNGSQTAYYFECWIDGQIHQFTEAKNAGSGRDPVFVFENLTGLLPNQTYHYRIVGRRGIVFTGYTYYYGEEKTFTTKPSPPVTTTTEPSDITPEAVRLNGTVNPNGSATYYQFEYGPDEATLYPTRFQGPVSGRSAIQANHLLSGFLPGTNGVYRLKAWNAGGTFHSGFENFSTPVISTSAASQITSDTAQVTGDINPAGSEITYWFEYWITEEGESAALTTDPQSAGSGTASVQVSANLVTLIPGKQYTYRLYSRNVWGQEFSDTQTNSFETLQEIFTFDGMLPQSRQPWYFAQPRSITTDSNGNVYVADTLNHRIQKFTAEGHLSKVWGKFGSRDDNGIVFNQPSGIALDANDNVYVADTFNQRIQKFTADGVPITTWDCPTNGELLHIPFSLAVSDIGANTSDDLNAVFVCIVSSGIQIFGELESGNYEYLQDFAGGYGPDNGQFDFGDLFLWGGDIDIHTGWTLAYHPLRWVPEQTVFVADYANNRVQKLKPDGTFLDKWTGSPGEDFLFPNGIAVSPGGNFLFPGGGTLGTGGEIGVLDAGHKNIKVFTPTGTFIRTFPDPSDEGVIIKAPSDISFDITGSICLADAMGPPVQKFSPEGDLVAKWAGNSALPGEFDWPEGICFDNNGFIYIADTNNHRIQKFNSEMQQVDQWYRSGGEIPVDWFPKELAFFPEDIGAGIAPRILVAGDNSVQVFDLSGNKSYEFNGLADPYGVAVDTDHYIYIADTHNHQILKFDKYYNLVFSQNHDGRGAGFEFSRPTSIACGSDNHLYVIDVDNSRVVKMTSQGEFDTQWGSWGGGDGQFNGWLLGFIKGITVGDDGFVYVSDTFNHRIQKFTPDGRYVGQFGGHGFEPGKFNFPGAVKIDGQGRFWVADVQNHRVQIFEKIIQAAHNKAIILAGGGKEGNSLWKATKFCADKAYWALSYQGYGQEDIIYLSSDTENTPYDADMREATLDNLWQAIQAFSHSEEDISRLTIFLADHGGSDNGVGTFSINQTDILDANTLQNWLSPLADIPVTLVVDSCYSGLFASVTPAQGIVITSTGSDEVAQFAGGGRFSFSTAFWLNVLKGKHLQESFDQAKDRIQMISPGQDPALYAYGEVSADTVYLGNATPATDASEMDTAGVVFDPALPSRGTIWITGAPPRRTVSAIKAVIVPPTSGIEKIGRPILEYPAAYLTWSADNARWEGVYEDFNHAGQYRILVYMTDNRGADATPIEVTATAVPTHQRKAVILVGGSVDHENWPAFKTNAEVAYQALRLQGYAEENIAVWSPGYLQHLGENIPADLAQKALFLNLPYSSTDTKDLVLFMIGPAIFNGFEVHNSERISSSELSDWIGDLGSVIIYEADFSGSFIDGLSDKDSYPDRIIVTSTASSGKTSFLSEEGFSFSRSFWNNVTDGNDVWTSYNLAANEIRYATGQNQKPELEDSGDRVCCQVDDGEKARRFFIGDGLRLSANRPFIGSVGVADTITGNSASIEANHVISTGTIAALWAAVTHPAYGGTADPRILPLEKQPSGSDYMAVYDHFIHFGTYNIAVSARNVDETDASMVKNITVIRADGPDIYEDDDTVLQANIFFTDGPVQNHNFYPAGDVDWIQFYATPGPHDIEAVKNSVTGINCSPKITLYDTDGQTPLVTITGGLLSYTIPVDGLYYVKVENTNPAVINTGYDLSVSKQEAGGPGDLYGNVLDKSANYSGLKAVVKITLGSTTLKTKSLASGLFQFNNIPSGRWSSSVTLSGYTHIPPKTIDVKADGPTGAALLLEAVIPVKKGDINGDSVIDQTDADLVMDVLTGGKPSGPYPYVIRSGYPDSGADVNGDGRIGPEELIYILGILP